MIEFTIYFNYEHADHHARVVKTITEHRVDYIVRPVDPSIVQKFGKQMNIFKEGERYQCENQIDDLSAGYFETLVNALKEQDVEEEDNA